jgi:hypothetical protein
MKWNSRHHEKVMSQWVGLAPAGQTHLSEIFSSQISKEMAAFELYSTVHGAGMTEEMAKLIPVEIQLE